jgi:hypothetical protein
LPFGLFVMELPLSAACAPVTVTGEGPDTTERIPPRPRLCERARDLGPVRPPQGRGPPPCIGHAPQRRAWGAPGAGLAQCATSGSPSSDRPSYGERIDMWVTATRNGSASVRNPAMTG